MLGNCPNLVRDSLYVRFAALCLIMIRCSLTGSTVYPGANFGVSLKLTLSRDLIFLLKVSAAAVVDCMLVAV